jgi:glutamate carboxypeptidase
MSSEFLRFFTDRTESMVEELRRLVEFESPTDAKVHVDRLGTYVAGVCTGLGAAVEVFPREATGDLLIARWNADAPGKPIMILTHLDTVWPVGTLDRMPLRRESGLLYGPGAVDMKGGVLVALEAIRALVERDELPDRPVWLFFNTDEERGSRYSRDLIQEIAPACGLVLVMEPGTRSEAIKCWRKGMARYAIYTKGRATHAGFTPEEGINAVIEAAHQALALHRLNDLQNGTSVSVTIIEGGFTINVIPPDARLEVDVRFLSASEAERVDQAIQSLAPVLPGAQVIVEGGIDRGPMAYDDQMKRAVGQLQAIGASIDLEIHAEGSGGASDGNFTAALGVPTLDGLGAAGAGLHAADEHVIIRSLPRRAALLARVLCDWDMDAV